MLDFDGVLSVSYSFADELVAELSERPGIGVSWINASPEVERVLQRAVAHRRGELDAAAVAPALTYL